MLYGINKFIYDNYFKFLIGSNVHNSVSFHNGVLVMYMT